MAFVWVDRERRYFISNCSSLDPGTPYKRTRWRQVAEVATNEEPERIEFEMPQPRCAEVYYAICAMVDQHNRSRQANLKIENKFVTKDWSMRVNLSIFSIITVDAWNVYKGILDKDCPDNENEFYALLAEDLILNTIDSSPSGRTRRQRAGDNVPSPSLIRPDGRSSSGIGAHLTPTKKRRKKKNGDVTNYLCQNWCLECKKMKTTYVCSLCRDENPEVKEKYFCNPRSNRLCFAIHVEQDHP